MTIKASFAPTKFDRVYGWLKLIISKRLPLTIVNDPVFRNFSRFDPICYNTLKKYLCICEKNGKSMIQKCLPQKFGILFDGWSIGSDHFIALFLWYIDDNGNRQQPLIAFKPINSYNLNMDSENQTQVGQTAEDLKFFICSVLSQFDRSVEDILFICCDNCNTNRKLCRDVFKKPMIGCFSHILNLACKTLFSNYEDKLIAPIEELMSKLCGFKKWAELSKKTELRPVLKNLTRWSSTFEMIKRYLDYVEPEILLDRTDPEVSKLYYLINENISDLRDLIRICNDLESITLGLQSEDASLSDGRSCFDGIISDYPGLNFEKYLAKDAKIVTTPDFLNAVYRQIDGQSLNEQELELLAPFKIKNSVPLLEQNEHSSYFLKLKKKAKIDEVNNYIDLTKLPCGSSVVERAFSCSGHIMHDLRKSMNDETLEKLMILYVNSSFWDINSLKVVRDELRNTEFDVENN